MLDLPEEIKNAVRDGALSERDTRVYQGLTAPQQRALHRARMAGELNTGETRQLARLLREAPEMTVAVAARLLQSTTDDGQQMAGSTREADSLAPAPQPPGSPADDDQPRGASFSANPLRPARVGAPTSIERLDWVRGHLARIDRHGLTAAERKEMLRLLKLIADDVASLTAALKSAEF